LAGYICRSRVGRGFVGELDLLSTLGIGLVGQSRQSIVSQWNMQVTYSTSTTSSAAATATAATTSTGRSTTAGLASVALGTATGTLSMGLGSAGKLNGDFAVEDSLAVELGDGTFGLGRGRQSHKGVADRARGTWVGGDGRGLAVERVSFMCASCHAEKSGPTYTR